MNRSQPVVRVRNFLSLRDVLQEAGVDEREILASVNLDGDLFECPDAFISYSAGALLMEAAAQATGFDDIGLRIGMRQAEETLGLAGFVASNAGTVREALEILQSSLRLTDGGTTLYLRKKSKFAYWYIFVPEGPASFRIAELCMAVSFNIFSRLCGSGWKPLQVDLPRPHALARGGRTAFFQAPVRFGAEHACLIFESKFLDQPVVHRNRDLYDILSPLLKSAKQREESFVADVLQVLHGQMLAGEMTLAGTAAALQMSSRTLVRRLSLENQSYGGLVRRVRLQEAQRLLKGGKTVAEAALMLGYADSTAFIRAFRRWTGTPPARWRAEEIE
ncbi:AraC family transcriptional regulator [Methylocystis echinoides]|uniref:AraC family transcriptional regulator n=1 Tax=Methylocystis echinoides TaxID=29468 RepID=UPI003448BEB4